MPKRINQTVIANKLGLSQRAVSKALNGEKDISEKTRQLVLDAAKKLRYRHNPLPQWLKDGKSGIIGVVIPRAQGLHFFTLWHQIEDEIFAAGYTPLMLRGGHDMKTDEAIFQLLLQYQVEGIIVLPHNENWQREFFEDYLKDQGKVVFIGKSKVKNSCCIYNDNYNGARLAVNYLVGLGHKKISYVGRCNGERSYNRMRYSAYLDELTDHKIKMESRYTINYDLNDDIQPLVEKLKALPEVTAVFCSTDKIAIKVYHACREMGLSVPEDISIMGYTNNLYSPDDMCIALSTINQKPELIGKTAVARIIAMIKGKKVVKDSIIDNELIVRKSTGKPNQKRTNA